uniref:Putative terminase n=1 Tax=viral metagenome TaxID=1070528 RepID=A0A6M3IHN6_9ZZZZ
MKLTQKQETFCLNYFECGNASEAARLAKYSPKTAGVIGAENLLKPKIQAKLRELNEIVKSKKVATVEERKNRLTEFIRANVADFADDEGEPVLNKDIPNYGAAREYYHRTKYGKFGNATITKSIKLVDPIAAISELNKMEKIYETSVNINQDNRVMNIIVESEETKKLLGNINQRLLRRGNDNQ